MSDTQPKLFAVDEEFQQEVSAWLRELVFPLFSINGDRQEPLGTAFLVEERGFRFLVSAAHVIERHTEVAIAYPVGESGLHPLTGLIYIDKANFGDVAVVALDTAAPSPLGIRCLTRESFSTVPMEQLSRGIALAVGFPVSRNRGNPYKGVLVPTVVGVLSRVVDPTLRGEFGYDSRRKVVIKFDSRRVRLVDGEAVVPPALNGTSGGPIFWLEHPIPLPMPRIVPVLGLVSSRSSKGDLLFGESCRLISGYIFMLAFKMQQDQLANRREAERSRRGGVLGEAPGSAE